MKVAVKTSDKYLYQKIKLMLPLDIFSEDENFIPDILLTDSEFSESFRTRVIKMSRTGDCELRIPFSEEELLSVLSKKEKNQPAIALSDRAAILRGERIALTEIEYSLFSALVAGGGEFIPRERLLKLVWGEGTSDGVLNVYIHYLREKLEVGGEKIIISSRKYGYKISERYLTEC